MNYLIYHISHKTVYRYSCQASASYHLIRLQPLANERQSCLGYRLDISPRPADVSRRRDYFGNGFDFVEIEGGHESLTVRAFSKTALGARFVPDPAETPSWEHARGMCLSDHSARGLDAMEFIFESPNILLNGEAAHYAKPSFESGRPLLDAAKDLTRRIYEDFTFDPKATHVSTPLHEVFKHRRGVCQDFAHVEIACLRSMGLPARYVSGYLETDPPPGQKKLIGADASHAWVSLYCPGIGWIDLDPTNNCLPTIRHVTVAFGRDYSDICPMRGVVLGGGEHRLKVAVDVRAEMAEGERLPAARERR